MSHLKSIRAYRRLDEKTATSGMPLPEHFGAIRSAGFEVVINLALPTSDNALANEGELVSTRGMIYVHIPVKFDSPTPDDFQLFTEAMNLFANKKVFVHCAANMRVSAFLFLHRLRTGSATRAQAEADLFAIWKPDDVWKRFINSQLDRWNAVALQ